MAASETTLTTVAGAALGAATGALVGLPVIGALAGGANGAVSGARQVYDWSTGKGRLAFALDSTWALATTTAGLVAHAVAATQHDAAYQEALSRRQNRHVYGRGFRMRKGFAITLGNVVNGAGDVTRPRKAKLVTDHEDVHVWQARWFGPLYPFLYGGWMAGAALVATVAWPIVGRGRSWFRLVETYSYYLNPFEWWAYSRDDHWPPSGKLADVGWQRPIVQSLASRRSRPV
ncbi:MAG: hypothetical protein RIB65_19450 [Ilumatobacter fluminis]|uniref:hypothetical protein n=1 Tax=Ilumatobacter fluminis TaxID=467091 RepID=UPI0032EB7477